MAYSDLMASLVLLLVLLPMTALGGWPNVTDICSQVACGKGTCQTNTSPFAFVCECDSGWRRTRLPDSEEQDLQFLPCVIPNCSMNYSCMPAAPPLPAISPNPYKLSFYDPCHWIYCGEGACNKSSDHNHTCECQPGAYNLLNISQFPCYSDCAIGSDCSTLGINVSSGSSKTGSGSSSGSVTLTTSANHASPPFSSGKLNWKVVMLMFIMMMPLK